MRLEIAKGAVRFFTPLAIAKGLVFKYEHITLVVDLVRWSSLVVNLNHCWIMVSLLSRRR
jgi:hypothetical protein